MLEKIIFAAPNAVRALLNALPVLGRNVRPNLACAIGFLAGGIGLAIYFRTAIDLILPLGLAIVAGLLTAKYFGVELGWLAGAVLASLYGYARALNSNRRRASVTPAVPATTGT